MYLKHLVIITVIIIFCGACISVKRGPVKAYNKIQENDIVFDAIIVPGVPFKDGHWDSIMKARVIWSWVLYKNNITKNVIYSGGAVYSPYYEARIMGLYAQKLGIPAEHIFYDTSARHSTENAYYSYLIAKENGFKVLGLATDPFQSALLKGFTFSRLETPIYHIPFIFDSVRKYNHLQPIIEPESARKEDFISITEEESPLRRFLGTMGGDLEWKQYENKRLPSLYN